MANKPIKKFKAGQFETSIWENEIQKDGRSFTAKSVSLRKSWKDNENWKDSTINLQPNDIPKASFVLRKAYEFIISKADQSNAE